MTITITMAFRGWISFPIAAAIVLGENIGTTITAFLASLPMGTAAKRTARAHMIFNLIGVFWMLFVFYPATRLVDAILPGSAADPENIPLHLSLFHTLFNVTNTALLLPFISLLAKVVEKLVPEKIRVSQTGEYRLALVTPNIPDALDSNLITIRGELVHMSRHATGMLSSLMEASQDPDKMASIRDDLARTEQLLDDMQEEITKYLTSSMRDPVGEGLAASIQATQRITHELEGISDACYSIGLLMFRLHKKGREFHEDGDQEIFDYTSQVLEFLRYNEDILDRKIDKPELDVAHEMENGIDKRRKKLRKRSRRSLERDKDTDVRGELIFIDIIRHLEHIGDNSLNISEAISVLD